jgi:hypothetical protein
VCSDAKRYFRGKEHDGGAIDLVIVDLLDGVPMPDLSFSKNFVPPWNITNDSFLDCLFSFLHIFFA